MVSFDNIWDLLMDKLKPGTRIANWTAFGGYLGDSMTISTVTRKAIRVEAPGAKSTINVPKTDFIKVWQVWLNYRAQRLRRSELAEITRYSKYIISIFHWLEEQGELGIEERMSSPESQLRFWE